jgi:AraC-like DNA-binding protein
MFEQQQIPDGIKTFGSAQEAEPVQPEDHVFILRSSELEQIIKQSIEKASEPLLARIEDLEDGSIQLSKKVSDLEAWQDLQGENQLIQLRIIKDLKDKKEDPGDTEIERCQNIMRYLGARPDHKASLETLRGVLGISESLLSQAIKALQKEHPSGYVIRRISGEKDGRRRELAEVRQIL